MNYCYFKFCYHTSPKTGGLYSVCDFVCFTYAINFVSDAKFLHNKANHIFEGKMAFPCLN